ncbi:DNA-binding protein [Limosilactobacillus reuteri]|nr:DNA-binding protein [Limosilactobacillus reuteri]
MVQAELKLSSELTNAIKIAITNATREAVNDLNKNNDKWPMYMNKGTAAKYLGISNNTLNEWISSDSVPFKKIGRSYRFNRNDLDKFMATK